MRTRLLHPEFAKHEGLGELSHTHRLLFAMLPMLADRQGLLEDRPRRIKAELFPYDADAAVDVDRLLQDLHDRGFIVRYEAGDKKCISIPGFVGWQKPHPRETPSELPQPPAEGKPRRAKGKPKASPRSAKETPRQPVSVSVSVSDPVSDPDPVSKTLPVVASDAGAEGKGRTVPTRLAYEAAFRERWGTDPLRSKSVNGQLSKFIELVGAEPAPNIAAFYVRHNQALYVNAKHPVNLLLRDAQKLATEWANGSAMTGTEARQIERTQANHDGWSAMLREKSG